LRNDYLRSDIDNAEETGLNIQFPTTNVQHPRSDLNSKGILPWNWLFDIGYFSLFSKFRLLILGTGFYKAKFLYVFAMCAGGDAVIRISGIAQPET
jgi:hypothetical protein